GETGGAGGSGAGREELLPAERAQDVTREVEDAGAGDEREVRALERPARAREALREEHARAGRQERERDSAEKATAAGLHPFPVGKRGGQSNSLIELGPAAYRRGLRECPRAEGRNRGRRSRLASRRRLVRRVQLQDSLSVHVRAGPERRRLRGHPRLARE